MVTPAVVTDGLEVIPGAVTEPVTLAEAYLHLRLDPELPANTHPDDPWLTASISAVRDQAERFTGLSLASKQYRLTLPAFATPMYIPRPPLISLDAITYDDENGLSQTLAASVFKTEVGQGVVQVTLQTGQTWPTTDSSASSVRLEFTAGYSPATIPSALKTSMLLMLGNLYKNREAITDREAFRLPLGVESYMRPYRIRLGMA